LEGVYRVRSSRWELFVGYGLNDNEAQVNGSIIEGTVKDMYVDNGTIYLVTEEKIYSCDGNTTNIVEVNSGVIGGDMAGGVEVRIKRDKTIIYNGKRVPIDKVTPRVDVAPFIKYINHNPPAYVVASRDTKGNNGYASGKTTLPGQQIAANIVTFGTNKEGIMCHIDPQGKIHVEEYDDKNGFDIEKTVVIPGSSIPINNFATTIAVGRKQFYVISTLKDQSTN